VSDDVNSFGFDDIARMPVPDGDDPLDISSFMASMLAAPRPRHLVVRWSLYHAHRRRWLAHLLSIGLGYRSTPPPFGCVA
jgi:hypothetical protein